MMRAFRAMRAPRITSALSLAYRRCWARGLRKRQAAAAAYGGYFRRRR